MTWTVEQRASRVDATAIDRHIALFYRDEPEYRDGVMTFIEPALAAGEPIAAAVPPDKGQMLRQLLGDAAAEIQLLDMFELGRNPARIIPEVERMLARHEDKLLHYVGEPIWPGRSDEEIREATRHEALINLAWPGAKIRVLCPYDAAALDSGVLADAARTHPRLMRGGVECASGAYDGPAVPAGCNQPLMAPPPDALTYGFRAEDLYRIRATVSDWATSAGLRPDRAQDLVLAISELATNAVRHGEGGGTLQLWTRPGRIVCQVHDRGGRIRDPLAGRRAPMLDAAGGLGLWTVNQLCDLVEVRTGETGTTVRIHATLG
jgi:anti-sigma regulatory factor (Ser/Thr protein kinase)